MNGWIAHHGPNAGIFAEPYLLFFIKKPIQIWSQYRPAIFESMDPKLLQGKVQAFAQRLLQEADGDPLRALGLLVVALDGSEVESAEDARKLMAEVRQVLIPEIGDEVARPVQHLAGEVSWEGGQHCLRCAKILARNCHERGMSFVPGYVYEVGPRFTSEDIDDFDLCH